LHVTKVLQYLLRQIQYKTFRTTTPLLNELCTEYCVSNVVYDNYLYSGPLSQN